MKRRCQWIILCVVLAGSAVASHDVAAGEPAQESMAPPTEVESLEAIERLAGSLSSDMPLQVRLTMNAAQLAEIVTRSDEFLKRFPKSAGRDRVLIAKIAALSELARARPEYLEQLLALTAEVASSPSSEQLGSENAFYAIQAFVMAARSEGMDAERRMQGTAERYRAFLKDHPTSHWAPVVGASLVRNLLRQDKVDEARREVGRLEKKFPAHRATKRARGELYRATAIGKSFRATVTAPDGKTIDTKSFEGKVLILHFWSGINTYAMDGLDSLRELYKAYADKGLALIGVNLDKDRGVFDQSVARLNLPWLQCREADGLGSDLVVRLGVIRIPTYFVIDRKGVLRYINPGGKLDEIVADLLSEKAKRP